MPDAFEPKPDPTLELIRLYLRSVSVTVWSLRRSRPGAAPVDGWADAGLPTRGELGRPSRGRYRLRGHGCVVQFAPHRRVEFDFGPGGRHDGFSPLYLARHVRLNKLVRRRFGDLDLHADLDRLTRASLIFRPEWEPTPELHYLTNEGKVLTETLYGRVAF